MSIRSKPANDAYRKNWDAIFKKKEILLAYPDPRKTVFDNVNYWTGLKMTRVAMERIGCDNGTRIIFFVGERSTFIDVMDDTTREELSVLLV